jgi:hypothetical protein
MKIIAIEEHFRPNRFYDYLLSRKDPPRLEIIEDKEQGRVYREWISSKLYFIQNPEVYGKSLDIDEKRLREMDETGIPCRCFLVPEMNSLGLKRM